MSVIATPAGFREARRQLGVTGGLEKRLLLWMAARVPAPVNSDHLTALGFTALVATGVLYAMSAGRPWALALANAALLLNWAGDSLDGTLARYRQKTRPRYGFYVDHLLDSVGAVALLGGLALSGLMSPGVAVALAVAYLLMSIEVFLATYTLGEFKIAYGGMGGTELRLVLAVLNAIVAAWPGAALFGWPVFDVAGAAAAAGVAAAFASTAWRNGARLYREETR
ncbi:MAG TPA: CDP-alcohol phosphatidyltransferase family protein [Vicinamibacteria bacterium]|nr:CDP-alcohol phosphatidyltransferase family protein [Vicinamibacteria bacterium]